MMKRIIFVFLLIFSADILFAQNSSSPVAVNGALNVVNGQIINQYGVPPELRGLSFSWSIWQGRKYYNTDVLDWICKDFKVSVVRLAMAVQPARGYLEEPDSQKQLIVTMADEAVKKGIYVLIDWHDHNSNRHLEQSKLFLRKWPNGIKVFRISSMKFGTSRNV